MVHVGQLVDVGAVFYVGQLVDVGAVFYVGQLVDVGAGLDVVHDLLFGGVVQLFDVVGELNANHCAAGDGNLVRRAVILDAFYSGSRVDSLFELDQQLLGVVAVVVLAGSHTGDTVAWSLVVVVGHNFFVGQLYGPDK